jgi:AraC-like DNA-binding protein
MAVVLETTEVEPEDRFDYWRDGSRRLFLPFHVERDPRCEPFWARSCMYGLCGIRISRTESDATLVVRTARDIVEQDPESFTVIVGLRGRTIGTQGGRSGATGPGDISIWDSSQPYRSQALGPTTVLTFALPKAMLRRDVAHLSTQTAVPVEGAGSRARLVRPYLCRLVKGLEAGDVAHDEMPLAEAVLSLVRSMYRQADPRLPGADLLLQVKAFIEDNLGDPRLDADQVAQAHFISRRYLYRLFEAERVGVREWIRLRRLQQSANDLSDPGRAHEGIFSIALRWGFTNPAHFSRCFRATYGLAPRDYREATASHQMAEAEFARPPA